MNAYKSVAIMNAAMWLACGLAIAVAVIITRRASPLWFLVVPALTECVVRQVSEEDAR